MHKIKRVILSLYALCFTGLLPAFSSNDVEQVPSTVVRSESLFNEGWRFSLTDNPQYRDANYDDSAWRSLTLPHDWSIEESYDPTGERGGTKNNGFFAQGLGWYRKEFKIAESSKDKMFTVQFDGVFMNSEVWINGTFLGRRPYGYSTFQYDMTPYLNFGEEAVNVIAVRVDNSLPLASRWYNGSGIYRNVHLIETSYTHFNNYNGVFITTPTVSKESSVVNVDYNIIANYLTEEELTFARKNRYFKNGTPHDCEITSIIYDKDGVEVARTTEAKSISSYDKYVTHTQKITVENPALWSAKSPDIYYMKSEISLDGKILDDKVTMFGIRSIEYNADKGLLVNGEQVKLNGVCLHHDAASLGAAVPDDVLIYRLGKLREMGCNAIRTSHNPFSPEFYTICDTMGFYVKNECFDEWRDEWRYNPSENPRGKAQNSYHLYFDQWAETDLRDMIHRDRNHPSVIMYGIGNEVPFFRDVKGAETTKMLVDICHREDNTRPVTLGNNAAEHTSKNGVDEQLDLMGYNYIMRQHPDSLYAPMRRLFPDMLFLGSETGNDLEYFLAYRDNDYVIGQFIWTGIDYLGETGGAPQRGWQSSLLDVSCNPRRTGYLFDCCWSSEPKVHLVAEATSNIKLDSMTYQHGITYMKIKNTKINVNYKRSWNWDKKENMLVNIYSNCDEVELKLNGRRIGRSKVDPDKYSALFEMPFKAGKLEAIGYRNGKVVCSDILSTASEASKIEAQTINSSLKADGTSVSIIEISICDKEGVRVPDATSLVDVNVDGDAVKFIGMDSGNLYYEGSFKSQSREATNGYLLLYLQSTGSTGESKITLSSDGLQPYTTTITAL
ncbi:MAG: glycoside hydrolase family 2 TIM barrel-domain containing protein [Rikenellaceae bacterium]